MREIASTTVHVSWVAGDPDKNAHISHGTAPPKMSPSSKYIMFISINYMVQFLASLIYSIICYLPVYEHVVKWRFRLVHFA